MLEFTRKFRLNEKVGFDEFLKGAEGSTYRLMIDSGTDSGGTHSAA
jgi:hypothetical protein